MKLKTTVVNLGKSVCHYCCHSFSTQPVGVPIRYKDGVFICVPSVFCSFPCACAYMRHEMRGPLKNRAMTLLSYLYRKSGAPPRTFPKCAPPRTALQMFGGPLTIEEFRDATIAENVQNAQAPLSFMEEEIRAPISLSRVQFTHPTVETQMRVPMEPRVLDSGIMGFLQSGS